MPAVPTRRIHSVIATVLAVIASAAVLTASKTSPIGRPGQDPSIGPTPGYPLIRPVSCVPQPVNPPDLTASTHSDQPLLLPSSPRPASARVTKYTSSSDLDLHPPSKRIHQTTTADAKPRPSRTVSGRTAGRRHPSYRCRQLHDGSCMLHGCPARLSGGKAAFAVRSPAVYPVTPVPHSHVRVTPPEFPIPCTFRRRFPGVAAARHARFRLAADPETVPFRTIPRGGRLRCLGAPVGPAVIAPRRHTLGDPHPRPPPRRREACRKRANTKI